MGEDGNRLQENGERPENLGQGELVVENKRQQGAWAQEVLHAECVDGRVVRWSEGVGALMKQRVEHGRDYAPVLHFHEVENIASTRNEEYLHEGVV